ncbi:hypothetical protein [Nocardioides alkalitolerans]|uniref:hypothetical protein n=1 Tax=Nocardioides alkalitolerans TaxID=281714 RepID=UPI00041C5CBD|nr:hypothetical protein [Nocardioides alkalitolerans]
MSANPPKDDRWKPYDDVRLVLVRNPGRLKPSRGLILDWRRSTTVGGGRRGSWEALVTYCDDAALRPVIKTEWLPRERLIPIAVDPNWTGVGDHAG